MMCRGKCAVLEDFVCCSLLFPAAPALSAVSTRWDVAYVSGTVTSHARGFPRFQGIKVAPSGLFPSIRERPIGSLVAGIWALLTALQIRSLSWECLACLGPLFRQWLLLLLLLLLLLVLLLLFFLNFFLFFRPLAQGQRLVNSKLVDWLKWRF